MPNIPPPTSHFPLPVPIPLLNPNEPEAVIAALHVSEGQRVAKGDLLCTLETTKSTAELVAEADGYVTGLRFGQGDTARAGEVLCEIGEQRAESSEQGPVASDQSPASSSQYPVTSNQLATSNLPANLRMTKPARALAESLGIDLSALPVGPLITEKMVREWVDIGGRGGSVNAIDSAPGSNRHAPTEYDPTAIVVYGGGGHGKSLIDLIRALNVYRIVGVIDDGLPASGDILGAPLLGGGETLAGLYAQGVRLAVNAVGGIGNVAVRRKVFARLAEAGFGCPALVHPTAFVEPSATLDAGVQVFPHAYVGSDARVGFGSIVNTGAIVSHDCTLGEAANVSPGALLAGGVTLGDGALVGMGVTVNLAVTIGAGARVGNGATVKADVPAGGVVRAGSVWPADR